MFPTPAPGSDDPLGLLRACHDRILGFCDLLERLPGHLAQRGADEALRNSAQRVLRYFDIAAPLHHQDEESNLFPLLLARQPAMARLLGELSTEHAIHERLWLQLADSLRQLERQQAAPELATRIAAFSDAMRAHVAIENAQVLPAAEQLLTPEQLHQLGAAMRSRRQ